MCTQTRELVAHVDINHHLGAPQHGGSPSFDMGIPDKERANHQNIDQHETSLNPTASTRSRRSGGRHPIAEGLGPLPQPRPAANLGNERHVLEEHEGDGDLRKKIPAVHDSIQDPLVLQLLKEVNKLKAERQAEIPDWNQPRPNPLIRKIFDTLLQAKIKQKLGLQLYTGREDPIEHLNLFESTMAYRMHTDE
ncbi:hypothetical protein COP1_012866 [Malus domestica]